MKFEIYPLSEKAISLYFEQKIDPEINDLVLSTCEWIKKNPPPGMVEVVPSYASFTLFYDLLVLSKSVKLRYTASQFMTNYLSEIPFNVLTREASEKALVSIPVIYDGADLHEISEFKKLSVKAIIDIHSAPVYRVYMMGFLPGFPYLGGLDERLIMPRKSKPRIRVPKGSVGIAGSQTGIYPFSSPGGWQLLGHTEQSLFDIKNRKLTLLEPGSLVKFVPA